ncbi:NAD(P)/FAD-dependent oxidoreductase [Vibrio hangzhouensis]|uniref:NADPH-dependent 2,4-dienoyl-CoA reductase, sulfur reductase n=1 Tax=Vibrio hangzhouensis TaxID=462991 RepID=A0A1H5Y4J6_9VIBR|nr:NAD(P)/FAD-dependent oxidoreductase [Vibrio hangzhouensis]SEG18979.1 NADPH-dependent 2,4-dienoyl-CoA reductase, sulfur reductase [Vibrio hangzhouensis]
MQDELSNNVDVCIIGAGPAGMSAAVRSAKAGASVVVIDEQPNPGGQIYRSLKETGHPNGHIFGPDYQRGAELVRAFNQANITHITQATLWRVDSDNRVYWSQNGAARKIAAKQIIIATGAIERPFPFVGWTLPGVMTAGAVQILMKTSGLVPNKAVLVGTGPLVYLLAAQMIDAGAPPQAIVDTQKADSYIKAIRYASGALKGRQVLFKGLKLLAKLRKAGIKRYTSASDIVADGNGKVEWLTFISQGRKTSLETQSVLAHVGVVPNVQLTRAMGLEHHWDALQMCWLPTLDTNNLSSRNGVYVAGDGGGIGGAVVAERQGELVAVNALISLGIVKSSQVASEAEALKTAINNDMAVRPFLDALYAPPKQALVPSDETIVCRCEEVTAGKIRQHAAKGVHGINQIKAYTRCGMGPCQGRYCGTTVAHIIQDETGLPMEKVGYYRLRNPIKPLKLGELASLTPINQSFMNKYRNKGTNNESGTTSVHQSANEQSSYTQ